jgi:hypothetical protein
MSGAKVRGLLVLFTMLALSPRLAFATSYTAAPGQSCQPAFGGTTVDFDDFGTGNQSTTATNSYICPIVLGTLSGTDHAGVTNMYLYYEDESSTNTFSCYPFYTTYGGSQYWGATHFTCSTIGGCADSTSSFTGDNYISWNSTQVPSYVHTYGYYWGDNLGFRCDVPPATSTNMWTRSWILGYSTQW